MIKKKDIIAACIFAAPIAAGLLLAACTDADRASQNLSTDADNFKIERRIVFYNTESDTVMLTIEGRCALGNADKSGELSVTCKTRDGYHKEFLGLSRNVTYVVQQLQDTDADDLHYLVSWRPAQAIPTFDIK